MPPTMQLTLLDVPPCTTAPARLPRERRVRLSGPTTLALPFALPAAPRPAPTLVPRGAEAPVAFAELRPAPPPSAVVEREEDAAVASAPGEPLRASGDSSVASSSGWPGGESVYVAERRWKSSERSDWLTEAARLLGGRRKGETVELRRPGAALIVGWEQGALRVRWTGPVAALGWLDQLRQCAQESGLVELE